MIKDPSNSFGHKPSGLSLFEGHLHRTIQEKNKNILLHLQARESGPEENEGRLYLAVLCYLDPVGKAVCNGPPLNAQVRGKEHFRMLGDDGESPNAMKAIH
jgi:hypothetical protein